MVERAANGRMARWVTETRARFQEGRQKRASQRALARRPPSRPKARPHRWTARTLAWSVHSYTALGLVCAAVITVLLVNNGPNAYRGSFLLMVLATIIDATDGTLARRFRVKEVVPQFDGRRLDDIVDFLTYTFLPILLIWRAEVLPPSLQPALLVPLLASVYGFCQTNIKTDDGYFLGFPSLWNVVALYVFLLPVPPAASLAIVVVLAILTFVPTRYLYPSSRRGLLNTITNILGAAWSVFLLVILWRMPLGGFSEVRADGVVMSLTWASLVFPIFYLGASWAVSVGHWRGSRVRRPVP